MTQFLVRFMVAVLVLAVPAGDAFAQAYPSKPITLIVPTPAGSGADIIARELADKLTLAVKQPVIVDNRGGAGGVIGTSYAAKSKPDGYTIFLGTVGTQAINQSLYDKLPYDPTKDFEAVTPLTTVSDVLVVSSVSGPKSLAELITLAKAKPGTLTFASPGNGSTPHLAGEMFKTIAGIDIRHVPYKSGSQALTDVISGQVTMMFYHIAAVLPLIKGGHLRPLGIATASRDPSVPNIPTMEEFGLHDFVVDAWMGIFVPAGTPKDIVKRLNVDIGKIALSPEMKAQMDAQGAHPLYSSSEKFSAFVKEEIPRWKAVIQRAGIKLE